MISQLMAVKILTEKKKGIGHKEIKKCLLTNYKYLLIKRNNIKYEMTWFENVFNWILAIINMSWILLGQLLNSDNQVIVLLFSFFSF